MARSRASAPKTSAPARSAAPAPAPHANHTSAQKPSAPAAPHNTSAATPQVTNVYVQRGGGGAGSGMLGTMAAVAGGSVIGHGISNYLYGQGNQAAPTQPAEAQELAQAAQQEHHACAPQLVGYSKCIDANPESADNCKWAWDYFQQCQTKAQPNQ